MKVLEKFKKSDTYEDDEILQVFENFLSRARTQSSKLFKQLKLEDAVEKSANLTYRQIYELLLSLASIFNGKINKMDLSSIRGSKFAGTMRPDLTKELNDSNNIFFVIDQSVTGMFERRRRIGL